MTSIFAQFIRAALGVVVLCICLTVSRPVLASPAECADLFESKSNSQLATLGSGRWRVAAQNSSHVFADFYLGASAIPQIVKTLRLENSGFRSTELELSRLVRRSRNDHSKTSLDVEEQLQATLRVYVDSVLQAIGARRLSQLNDDQRVVLSSLVALTGLFEADFTGPAAPKSFLSRILRRPTEMQSNAFWDFHFQEFVTIYFRRHGYSMDSLSLLFSAKESNSQSQLLFKTLSSEIELIVARRAEVDFEESVMILGTLVSEVVQVSQSNMNQEVAFTKLLANIETQFRSKRMALASSEGQIQRKSNLLNQFENLLHQRLTRIEQELEVRRRIVVALENFHRASESEVVSAEALATYKSLTHDMATIGQDFQNIRLQLETTQRMLNVELPAFRRLLDAVLTNRDARQLLRSR